MSVFGGCLVYRITVNNGCLHVRYKVLNAIAQNLGGLHQHSVILCRLYILYNPRLVIRG